MKNGRIKSAINRNRAKHILGHWKVALSTALGSPVSDTLFLSSGDTAALKKDFFLKVRDKASKDIIRLNWQTDNFQQLLNYAEDSCLNLCGVSIVLFSSVDDLVGAVSVPADSVLSNLMPVWNVVKNDLCMTTTDLKSGFCLERNYYDLEGKYVATGIYELTVWGRFVNKQ